MAYRPRAVNRRLGGGGRPSWRLPDILGVIARARPRRRLPRAQRGGGHRINEGRGPVTGASGTGSLAMTRVVRGLATASHDQHRIPERVEPVPFGLGRLIGG